MSVDSCFKKAKCCPFLPVLARSGVNGRKRSLNITYFCRFSCHCRNVVVVIENEPRSKLRTRGALTCSFCLNLNLNLKGYTVGLLKSITLRVEERAYLYCWFVVRSLKMSTVAADTWFSVSPFQSTVVRGKNEFL